MVTGSPKIWMHAVSVGEVSAAVPIIKSLAESYPDGAFILSTGTEHGQAFAKDRVGSTAHCVYAPFDFFLSARRALKTFSPDVFVCVETELWPNWLVEAHRMNIKTVLVNGRISVRSIRKYLKIRSLMFETLKHVRAFSMIGEADADRIRQIGAKSGHVYIHGNAKYDLLIHEADAAVKTATEKAYHLNGNQPVFVAGSIRGDEASAVLNAYERIIRSIPETILIIAPRHVKRARQIEAQIKARGLTSQFKTELDNNRMTRSAPIVIVDTIGQLKATYSIASVVFCGGSLVPRGGQNILEAAVWAKPVLYGPSMEDFLDAKEMMDKTGGGIQVNDGPDLTEKVLYYLNHPDEAESIGSLAQRAVFSHKGAAQKHAAVVQKVLEDG
jgi:3-deoxy-D-manno-octulosonic-acid transferase